MQNEFYHEAYKAFREGYDVARSASFLPLGELRALTQKVIGVYTKLVPKEVRESFEIKVSDLEDFLKAREFVEGLIVTSKVGV